VSTTRSPKLVWCPANINEMNMPVTSSAEKPRRAVLVLDGDQHVEHVAVGLVLRRIRQPSVHDLLHQRDEFSTRASSRRRKLSIGRYGST